MNRVLPVALARATAAAASSPRFRTVSIIPGIETGAPDRTDTSNGLGPPPKDRRVVASRAARWSRASAQAGLSGTRPYSWKSRQASVVMTKPGGTGRPADGSCGPDPRPCRRTARRCRGPPHRSGRPTSVATGAVPLIPGAQPLTVRAGRPSDARMSSWNSNQMLCSESDRRARDVLELAGVDPVQGLAEPLGVVPVARAVRSAELLQRRHCRSTVRASSVVDPVLAVATVAAGLPGADQFGGSWALTVSKRSYQSSDLGVGPEVLVRVGLVESSTAWLALVGRQYWLAETADEAGRRPTCRGMESTLPAEHPTASASTSRSAILRRYSAFRIRNVVRSICPLVRRFSAQPRGTSSLEVRLLGEGQIALAGEDLLRDRHLDEVPLGDLVVVVRTRWSISQKSYSQQTSSYSARPRAGAAGSCRCSRLQMPLVHSSRRGMPSVFSYILSVACRIFSRCGSEIGELDGVDLTHRGVPLLADEDRAAGDSRHVVLRDA